MQSDASFIFHALTISFWTVEEEREEDVGVGRREDQKEVRRDISHHRSRRQSATAKAEFHIQR